MLNFKDTVNVFTNVRKEFFSDFIQLERYKNPHWRSKIQIVEKGQKIHIWDGRFLNN